jgi:hypothetical protein
MPCKYCSCEESHEFATIQEIRTREDALGVQITTTVSEDGDICIRQKMDCKMKHRQNNCYHLVSCENCNSVRSICVYQDKGTTCIEEELPAVLPYIAGLVGMDVQLRYIGRYLCQ